MDAMGRQVRKLLPEQLAAQGTMTVSWDHADDLPAGVYYIVPVREGRALKELTQCVVRQ